MKKLLLLLNITIITFALNAQDLVISGKIVEQSSDEPLQYATIGIYNSSDSLSSIANAVSDLEGDFSFVSLFPGNYHIEISFIGFETKRIDSIYLNKSVDLGNIPIKASNYLLDDVEITGNKSTLVQMIDKKVYNVGNDVSSESVSASEILQNIPSVTVDINGNVSLRGTSNILYLINGRPSSLLRRDAANALQQIPAATIDRIEVITNPSAKYKPDGTGGIINIVLKKETKPGFNGQVSANVGNEERYNANVMANYGGKDWNIHGNYSLRHSARTYYYSDDRIINDSTGETIINKYFESGHTVNDGLAHIFSGGMSFEINDNNSFELSGSYFSQNTNHKGVSDITNEDGFSNPETHFTSNETNDEFEHEGESVFAWEHVFGDNEVHALSTEIAFASYNEEEDLTFMEDYSFPEISSNVEKILIQKGGYQTEVSLEYNLPVGEDAEIESGYAGEFVQEDIRYSNNDNPNRFLLNQNVHAIYGIYAMDIEDFSFKAGIRVEQTNIRSHLKEPIDSLIPNDYFKPYPTLHLAYSLNENQTLFISYSKRINRPDADEMNPFPEFSDPRNAYAGNPYLKPQQIHSLELGYQLQGKKLSFNPTLYYRYMYDAFTSIRQTIGDTLVLSTIENLDNRKSAGIELVLSGELSKNWEFDLSANVFYDQIDATGLGFSDKKSVFSTDIKFYLIYKLTKKTLFQFNAYYHSPRITPQGQRSDYYYLNAGIKQQIFRKRATLTFTVTDMLHTYRISREIDTPELFQTTKYQRKNPIVYFGFTWFFKPQKETQKEIKFDSEGL